MKVKSSKLRVKSYSEKLFTFHFSLFTDKRGFTLIEVIMIIVVVAIAIPALLIILGQEAKQSVNAELQVSATNVAQAQMEATLVLGFSGIVSTTYSTTVGGNTYSGDVTVCYVQAAALDTCVGGPTDYKRISVTVTSPTQAELVTVVTNY